MKNHDHLEEEFYGRKERKTERKLASKTDRSKFKKTDRDKIQKREEKEKNEEERLGRVLSVLPEEIVVDIDGQLLPCVLKGRLKKERKMVKNLVVVGDFVHVERDGGISYVEPRRSLLSRKGSHHHLKEQIIASNIDIALITTSILSPPLNPSMIDRFIIAATAGGMEPVIVINKIDLVSKGSPQEKLLHEIIDVYKALNFRVISLSATVIGEGLEELKEVMRGRASLFAGESGVGKSSLINALTGLSLATQEVAKRTQKGVHTTTGAKLIPLIFGGWCIDSPGIQSFGLWDLKKTDLKHYFYEMNEVGHECKYPDCSHTHEPGCAVLEAVKTKEISPIRYESYLKLLSEMK
jgi:ribosome biogenesis GTPase